MAIPSESGVRICLSLICLLYAGVVFCTAWLAEDAFITFRTVDNFINGYGLTWNTGERVQAYTHPLWMFLVSACYFATREISLTTMFLSLAVSSTAVWIFVRNVADSAWAALGVLALIASRAFIDYSTSGLENPLTHLLLALFVVLYLREKGQGNPLLLSLVVGLALINRMDLGLIFGPGLLWALWQRRSWPYLSRTIIGLAPLALWILFSLLYYGFPFPNTAYAKLGTGVGAAELFGKGMNYLVESCRNDPVTPLLILAGIILPLAHRDWRVLALSAGGLLYSAYVVKIGGDYMLGRFLAAPFWLAVLIVFLQYPYAKTRILVTLSGILLILGLYGPYLPLLTGGDYGEDVRDQRTFAGLVDPRMGLMAALTKSPDENYPDHWWAERGRRVREGDLDPHVTPGYSEGVFAARSPVDGKVVITWSNVGMSGFYAGPQVHILDMIALTEPLLARLPAKEDPETGAGHYGRIIPEGYLETRLSGENRIVDEQLARYYQKLRVVVEGKLVSTARIKEIWHFNTGHYDYLIDRHRYRYPTRVEEALSAVRMRPKNPEKLIELGKAYFAADEQDRAIEALETAIEWNWKSFKNHFAVGMIFSFNGQPDLARSTLAQAIRLGENQIPRLEERGEIVTSLDILKRLILIHKSIGGIENRAAVGRIYNRILLGNYPLDEVDKYIEMGQFFVRCGQVDSALRAYAKALQADPESKAARVNYGWSLYLIGELDKAVEQFQHVLSKESNSVAAFNLGLVYLAQGKGDEAQALYQHAIAEYGKAEARHIGAVDDFYNLAAERPDDKAVAAIATIFENDE